MHPTTVLLLILPILASLTLAQYNNYGGPDLDELPRDPTVSAILASASSGLANLESIQNSITADPSYASVVAFFETQTAVPTRLLVSQQLSYQRAFASGVSSPSLPFITALPSDLQDYASSILREVAVAAQTGVGDVVSAVLEDEENEDYDDDDEEEDGRSGDGRYPPVLSSLRASRSAARATRSASVSNSANEASSATTTTTTAPSTSPARAAPANTTTAPVDSDSGAERVMWGLGRWSWVSWVQW